jgi:hypothetical protein
MIISLQFDFLDSMTKSQTSKTKRGRPKKYKTPEECRAAKTANQRHWRNNIKTAGDPNTL